MPRAEAPVGDPFAERRLESASSLRRLKMTLPTSVTIREVGPRDGIQSLGAFIPTEQKIEMVDALSRSGLKRIEATSFVHPKLVPQMADAETVMERIDRRPGVSYEVLVPNVMGARRAVGARPDMLHLV